MNQTASYLQAFLALGFVLLLIWGASLILRRLAERGGFLPASTGRKARRLQIIDVMPLDPRRRAVILRCDQREHLVIVGETTSILVDRDIPPPERNRDAAPPVSV